MSDASSNRVPWWLALAAVTGGLVALGVWAVRGPSGSDYDTPARQLASPPTPVRSAPAAGPAERAPGVLPEAPDPADGPTLERPEVDARFAEHADAVRPRWRRVGAVLQGSDQPELQGVAVDIEARLTRAVEEGWPSADRADLVHEQRQLVMFLRQRYAGFEPLEAPLDAIDQELTTMDGGAN